MQLVIELPDGGHNLKEHWAKIIFLLILAPSEYPITKYTLLLRVLL